MLRSDQASLWPFGLDMCFHSLEHFIHAGCKFQPPFLSGEALGLFDSGGQDQGLGEPMSNSRDLCRVGFGVSAVFNT